MPNQGLAHWTLEPHDPLVVRDGRPFSASPGARAVSLDFPFPSTLAGAVRTRAWATGTTDADALLALEVQGPMLVELGPPLAILAPAPADCVVLGADPKALRLRRLRPLQAKGVVSAGLGGDDANPVVTAMVNPDKAKPYGKAPRFWHWTQFARWLKGACDEDNVEAASLGHGGPTDSVRSHVQIEPATRAAAEGKLFQTRGYEYLRGDAGLSGTSRLGLLFATNAPLANGVDPFGGERRMARWRQTDTCFPKLDAELLECIVAHGGCRVILLTPAWFEQGWKPSDLFTGLGSGVTATLVGAAVGRPHTVSGWDLSLGAAKPSRRLAPAGSVYFLQIDGDRDKRRAFVQHIWMHCVSDGAQNRLDGFGLAAVGAWDPTTMGGIA